MAANANVLAAKFVITVKNAETPHECLKARFTVQGYIDELKQVLVRSTSYYKYFSTKN